MYDLAVVSAGLSRPSSTRMLADRLAAATADALGGQARVHAFDLRDHARALADNLVTGFPGGALREVLETVTGADGLIAVTPVFNASYSGLFKTFFDVVEPGALEGTPVLLGATGGTARHSLVIDMAMRPLMAYLRATAAPTGVYAASEDWGSGETGLAARIERAGGELAALVAARTPAARPDPYAEPVPFAELLGATGS
ncbi:FMN reductase [Actinomadura macrotermitis]|uniref:FMN reductase (NADPH) n=1 Tax=Actinomadura macrotermitis TaxID=2585200 RepID=A0A7K0C872_9ACTN|nr:FMN reductase [Actinomadura macrotermitis]MQY09312.1 FMN reductase (NADPH) [Actinomadura macrotermitis]